MTFKPELQEICNLNLTVNVDRYITLFVRSALGEYTLIHWFCLFHLSRIINTYLALKCILETKILVEKKIINHIPAVVVY